MSDYNYSHPHFIFNESLWDSTNESVKSLLQEFLDNGLAEREHHVIKVNYLQILELSLSEKNALGLPDESNYDLRISSEGSFNNPNFKFKFNFYTYYPGGDLVSMTINGPVLSDSFGEYLLDLNQFEAITAINEFNQIQKPSNYAKFKNFKELKEITVKSSIILEEFLNNEEIIIPSKIKLEPKESDNGLSVSPQIEIEGQNDFEQRFKLGSRARENYPVKTENGRVRVVFNDSQTKALTTLKQEILNNTSEDVKEKLLNSPTELFDPDIFDLDYYSERVKELGLYKPKFYPFVSPYKSEWIPGVKIVHPTEGTKKINISDFGQLEELKQEINKAVQNRHAEIEWKDTIIPVATAQVLAEVAEKQLKNPKEKVKKEDLEKAAQELVLIIEENADYLGYIEEVKAQEKITELPLYEVSSLRNGIKLKAHQEHGVAWMQYQINSKVPGCLLADDMGLGKTLQVLYLLEYIYSHREETKPSLVVAPVSLLENWKNEYDKFFSSPALEVLTLYGGNLNLSESFDTKTVEELSNKRLILTNYETLRRYQINLAAVDFALVVLDEAQRIKTPGTIVTNAAKALKARFKLAMTGTPVENSLLDLWCILDFATPGFLGTAKDFAKEFQAPLKKEDANLKEIGEKLYRLVEPLVMRRLKFDVAKDLPAKKLVQLEIEMPLTQRQAYEAVLSDASSEVDSPEGQQNKVLKALWAMRDVSDHPFLLSQELERYEVDELIATSGKLKMLVKWVENIKQEDEKVIIFADRRETQRMIQRTLNYKFGIGVSIINGETPSIAKERSQKKSRQETIDRFQSREGFNAIVMSPLAAGVGLNVTEANHVIHYSRHWNPAKEDQATDRAYRIGQSKDVYVYYPLLIHPEFDSFDIVLNRLLENKRALSSNTLFPTEQIEVKPIELFDSFVKKDIKVSERLVAYEELQKMKPSTFEAFVAALFDALNYDRVILTPLSNDHGGDVLAFGETNYVIQAKRYKNNVSRSAIQEVGLARLYYEKEYAQALTPLIVTTSDISSANHEHLNLIEAEIWNGQKLKSLIEDHKVSWQSVFQAENNRE